MSCKAIVVDHMNEKNVVQGKLMGNEGQIKVAGRVMVRVSGFAIELDKYSEPRNKFTNSSTNYDFLYFLWLYFFTPMENLPGLLPSVRKV
jgi:hypothetical protein